MTPCKTLVFVVACAFSVVCRADELIPNEDLRRAIERGLSGIVQGSANYPKHRQCFSCHHQTLPALALDAISTAKGASLSVPPKSLEEIVEHTRSAFDERKTTLESGAGIGGKSLTVSYGLWTLDLAKSPGSATTTAMVTYLLKTQEVAGNWQRQSRRPPLSESLVTATVLSAHFASKYANAMQKDQAAKAKAKAVEWLRQAPLVTNEDFAFRLWGAKLLGENEEQIASHQKNLLNRQRDDGGWAAENDLPGDAYATGQSLYILSETGFDTQKAAYQRGVAYLLKTQLPDGSWKVETRSTPVQVFFDNGDPHGKSQFISFSARCWAVAALARSFSGEK